MTGKTHTIIGVAAVTSAMSMGWLPFDMVTIMAASVGSILPDIDTEKSSINNALNLSKAAYFVLAFAVLYFQRTLPGLIIAAVLIIISFSRHRGITHSLLGVGILVLLTWKLQFNIKMGVIVGYTLHLLADFFTPHGIEVFYPNKKNFKVPKAVRIGKSFEGVLGVVLTVLIIYNAYKYVTIII